MGVSGHFFFPLHAHTAADKHLLFSLFFGTRMTREEYQSKVAKRVHKGEVPKSKVNGPNELAAPPTSERNGIALKEKVN